ncbi:amidohydrolase family protein [Paraburkholderia fungorum]
MRMISTCACCAPASLGRRHFLAGTIAVAASTAIPSLAVSAPDQSRVIDVHHHFEPSGKNYDGMPWKIENAVEQLDQNAVSTAIAFAGAIFTADVPMGRPKACEINEWGTKLCLDHPGRFGLFASIPMNDVDGALVEIAYVFDVRKADGIELVTNYQSVWLGEPKFAPIFAELNRRKAVVFVQPSEAPCCTGRDTKLRKAARVGSVDRISDQYRSHYPELVGCGHDAVHAGHQVYFLPWQRGDADSARPYRRLLGLSGSGAATPRRDVPGRHPCRVLKALFRLCAGLRAGDLRHAAKDRAEVPAAFRLRLQLHPDQARRGPVRQTSPAGQHANDDSRRQRGSTSSALASVEAVCSGMPAGNASLYPSSFRKTNHESRNRIDLAAN